MDNSQLIPAVLIAFAVWPAGVVIREWILSRPRAVSSVSYHDVCGPLCTLRKGSVAGRWLWRVVYAVATACRSVANGAGTVRYRLLLMWFVRPR